MRIFLSEFNKNYATYTFSYAVYATLEAGDKLSNAYEQGFLPYAGESEYSTDKPVEEIYYRCRSLRVSLSDFTDSSENRRVMRKAANFNIGASLHEKEAFLSNEAFHSFCQHYAGERFKGGHMDQKRWEYVLQRESGTHIFEFTIDEKPVGYVLAGIDDTSVHYWFSFFDTSYLEYFPIGKYMMHQIITWAMNNAKQYVYLGTCYGPAALYKARDFKGVTFFDGSTWQSDITRLKTWCKQDDEILQSDRYKIN